MDRGAWQATVHGLAKSQTYLSYSVHMHIFLLKYFEEEITISQTCVPETFGERHRNLIRESPAQGEVGGEAGSGTGLGELRKGTQRRQRASRIEAPVGGLVHRVHSRAGLVPCPPSRAHAAAPPPSQSP